MKARTLWLIAFLLAAPSVTLAQLAPEIGYMFPSGGQAGTTVEVTLGGYDWTPDMQLFVHDPRLKLDLIGAPSPVLVPEPPYWFGAKGRGPAWPLPREFKAKLTIPADVAPGLIRWQVANANGASPVGTFHVGQCPEVVEDANRKGPQPLPSLPVTVSGQIRKIEEVDAYEFMVPKAGPVTLELIARQLGSPLHGIVQVKDSAGRMLVDVADSEGRDLTATFLAQPNEKYTLRLHDLDYAGDRSYVYRLLLTQSPRVLAAFPSAGRRGETRKVEFVGIGIATGAAQLESLIRDVTFPSASGAVSHAVAVETPFGTTKPFSLLVTSTNELVELPGTSEMTLSEVPAGVTGALETKFGSDHFTVTLKKGDKWQIAAQAAAIGSPLDLELQLLGPDGKPVAINDDEKGTTDAALTVTVPTDGTYRLVVTDRSGKSGSRAATYRLSIEPQAEDFTLAIPTQLPVPLGSTTKLTIKAVREGGFQGPIPLAITGLPQGVTAPADLAIPEKKNDVTIDLTCVPDAPANASLATFTATLTLNGQPVSRQIGTILLATTLKPRIKLTPEGLDDVRKVHRGSTFLAPVLIERLEGYSGPITLEMTAKQQRHRQGLASDEFIVPPDGKRVEYPIFVPEWMETTKTSRMILNGSVQVADPKGTVRTLLQRQELRIGILPEGALMKLSHAAGEPQLKLGGELTIPLSLSVATELREPITISLVPSSEQAGLVSAEPISLPAGQKDAQLTVRFASDAKLVGEQTLLVRAATLRHGWPVRSEATILVTVRPTP